MRNSLFVLLIVAFGCGEPDPRLAPIADLHLGENVPSNAVESESLIVVSAGQMQRKYTCEIAGVPYVFGVDSEGLVQYVSTRSKAVTTPEGVKVGDTFRLVVDEKRGEFEPWNGWGHVVELPSGWNAAFFIGYTMTDRTPINTDTVDLLFRGTRAGYGVGHPPDQRISDLIHHYTE